MMPLEEEERQTNKKKEKWESGRRDLEIAFFSLHLLPPAPSLLSNNGSALLLLLLLTKLCVVETDVQNSFPFFASQQQISCGTLNWSSFSPQTVFVQIGLLDSHTKKAPEIIKKKPVNFPYILNFFVRVSAMIWIKSTLFFPKIGTIFFPKFVPPSFLPPFLHPPPSFPLSSWNICFLWQFFTQQNIAFSLFHHSWRKIKKRGVQSVLHFNCTLLHLQEWEAHRSVSLPNNNKKNPHRK